MWLLRSEATSLQLADFAEDGKTGGCRGTPTRADWTMSPSFCLGRGQPLPAPNLGFWLTAGHDCRRLIVPVVFVVRLSPHM